MWPFTKKTEQAKRDERLEKFKRGDVKEYNNYLSSPGRIFFANFLAGMSRGLGLIIGVALVLTLVTFILTRVLSQIPFVGDLFSALNLWIQETISKAK